MIQLRDYQSTLTDQARENIRAKVRRQLLVAPTGAGKTVIAAFVQGGAAQRVRVTWFVVPRIEILLKTAETFAAVGIDFGIVAAGYPLQPEKLVQLCMVGTLVSRMHLLPKPDGIVFDEAHHLAARTHGTISEENEQAWHVGLTATPERLDGKGLRPYFDSLVVGPTPGSLMGSGYLASYRYYAPGNADLGEGRGSVQSRADVMGDNKLIGAAVDNWGKLAEGTRTLNFELSVRSSLATVEAFRTSGVSAAHVDGDMHPDQRKELFDAFSAGEITVMSNCYIFGEGTDVPGIETVMLRDPTNSLTKYLQECGRAFRPVYADGYDLETQAGRLAAMADSRKPFATILDYAGNAFDLGMPDQDRTWSLDGAKDREKRQRASDAIPIRQCPQCYRVAPSTVRVCLNDWCSYEFATVWKPPQWAEGDLYELKAQGIADKEAAKKAATAKRKSEERACGDDIAAWIRLGMARGYKSPKGWALNQLKIRGDYAAKFRRRA